MKKIWIACISLLLAFTLCFGIVGCANGEKDDAATISVSVNGTAQQNNGTVDATVGTPYTIAAAASNGSLVSVSYVFGTEAAQTLSGQTFTPEEEGNYVFTFTAEGADNFVLTFAAEAEEPGPGPGPDEPDDPDEPVEYTVTYAVGDHAAQGVSAPASVTEEEDTEITLPAALQAAEGYTFAGWSDGTTVYDAEDSYTVTKTVTLTAVWKAIEYTATFNVGDHAASGATVADMKADYNTKIKLPAGPAAAEGYTFVNWKTGDTTYNAGASYTVTADVTFTAQWQETATVTEVTVSFNVGDHAASSAQTPENQTAAPGGSITLPAAIDAAQGYSFKGWSDGSTTYIAGTSYNVTGNVTLTAVWEAVEYTVSFNVGDHAASGATVADMKADYNTKIELPAAPEAADTYMFDCWKLGGEEYQPGDEYTVTGDVTFTAEWTQHVHEYTLTYANEVEYLEAQEDGTAQATCENGCGGSVTVSLPAITADGWADSNLAAGFKTMTWTDQTSGAKIVIEEAYQVTNGGFEYGTLDGWQVLSGQGASVSDSTEYWEADTNFMDQNDKTVQRYLQDGTYFLVTDETNLTAVRSETFTVAGDGTIAFRFGIAKSSVSYVALCDADTNAELIKVTNSEYFNDPLLAQVLLLRFMYAHDYIGEEVYIKVVDGATADFGFLNFDDLRVNLTNEEAAALLAEEKAEMATYRQDVLDSTAQMGGRAKEIINAIRGYYSDLTLRDIEKLTLVSKITDKAVSAGNTDITAYLAEAAASKYGVPQDEIEKAIVKINDGSQDYTSGFTSFNLEAGKTYTVTYTLSAADETITETFTITVNSSYQIINGDFETGDLTGWEYVGSTSGTTGVDSTTECWNGSMNQEGNYHYDGWVGTNEAWTGVLRSTTFELGGNGMISFRLGGCNRISDPELGGAYLSVKKTDGTEVARFVNTKQEPYNGGAGKGEQYMWVYAFDLSSVASIGDQLYIEIVDNATGGWGLLFLDDVQTYHTEESFAALGTVNTDYFMAENKI